MRFILFVIACLSASPAQAVECYDEEPVVDISREWDLSAQPRADFYLPTRTIYGVYNTWAAGHISWNDRLYVLVDYNTPKEEPFSLPYTVHRIRIEVGQGEDQWVYDEDYTRGCRDFGRSILPPKYFKLPPMEIPGKAGPRPVRIRVWGKHV